MTNTSPLTKASKHLVARLTATAFAGMLATFVVADTASAETLQQLRRDLKIKELDKPKLDKPKVPAGSLPGHPDKMIDTQSSDAKHKPSSDANHKPPPPPTDVDYSDLKPRPGAHRFHDPVCHDGTCESE
jgi:hypothetical protein